MDSTLAVMAPVSVLFAVTAAYLQVNKLWQRKHLAEVAESISLAGILVKMFPLTFSAVYFLSKGDFVGIIDSSIWLTTAIIIALIGAGFWVPERRGVGFWQLARGSLQREGAEVTVLAKELLNPTSSRELVDVLTSMAAVDGELDNREIDLIDPFIVDWGVEVDWEELRASLTDSRDTRLLRARDAVAHYLGSSPSERQVGQLRDLLQLLIDVDDTRTEEEQLAFEEIDAMLAAYLAGADARPESFAVVIAPQDREQDEAIASMLKDVEEQRHAGGRGYAVGRFHSGTYARIICERYRSLGFFTVVMAEQA